jgi:hypothetical protein
VIYPPKTSPGILQCTASAAKTIIEPTTTRNFGFFLEGIACRHPFPPPSPEAYLLMPEKFVELNMGDTVLEVKTLYIELGSPLENGYIESVHEKLSEQLLNVEIFTMLFDAQVLIENWKKDYNQIRPHSALGYRPPAPEAILPGYGSTRLTLSVVQ